MMMNIVPSFEERPLVHSETVLMDLSHIGTTVSDSALTQLGNAKVKMENLIAPGAYVSQMMGPMVIQDINVFRANLLGLKPTYEQDLVEHYNFNIMNGIAGNLSQAAFVQLVYDTVFKIYHAYHFFFCNIFVDLRNKCSVLGFPNVELIVHLLDVQNCVGKMSLGCYAR